MTLSDRKQERCCQAEQHHAVQRLERTHQPPVRGQENLGMAKVVIALSE